MALTKVTGQVINSTTDLSVGVATVGGGTSTGDLYVVGVATFSGDISIGGTLTYEDVTNVDSVGLITARKGISVTGGDVKVGSGITLSRDGDVYTTGITTIATKLGIGSVHLGGTATDGLLTIKGDTDNAATPSIRIIDTTTDTREVSISNHSGDFVTSVHGADNTVHGSIKLYESGLIGFANGGASGSNTERFRINVDGKIGIGTNNPANILEIFDTAATVLKLNGTNANGTNLRIQSNKTDKMFMGLAGDFITSQGSNVTDSAIRASGALLLATGGGTERARIDSSGRILQGKTSTKGSTGENVPTFCNELASVNPNVFEIANNGTNANSYPALVLSRSDGGSVNSHTAVDSGDQIGELCFIGADGADRFNTAAAIKAYANADFTANDCPAYLSFFTNGGSASASERLRITSGGKVTITDHGTNDLRSLSVLAPQTQIQFGTADDVGGFLMSSNNGQFGLSGGGYFNGSSWVAKHTGSAQIRSDGDGAIIFSGNASLTAGNTFTPTERFKITTTGQLQATSAADVRLTLGSSGTAGTNDSVHVRADSANLNFMAASGGVTKFEVNGTETMAISSAGYMTTPKQVAFRVYGTGGNTTYDGEDIILTLNILNRDTCYNTSNGRFTAPVAGIYLFHFGFFPNSGSSCRIELKVNGSAVTNPYITGIHSDMGSGFPMPSAGQILNLGASDYVTIAVNGTLTNTYNGHTGFSGVLLG